MPLTDLTTDFIEQSLSAEYGHSVKIFPVKNEPLKSDVADATSKFFVPTPMGHSGFMLISGVGNPHLVQRSVDNIRAAKNIVSDQTGAFILPPIVSGRLGGRTFAVWEMKRPFLTSNRVVKRLRGHFYARRITQWISAFCNESKFPANPDNVLRDLHVIIEDSAFPDNIRRAAQKSTVRLEKRHWDPQNCLQHGDFWSGNLLLPTTSKAPSFYVVDWAGMERRGYPFLDLSRILMSLRRSNRFNADCIINLSRDLDCAKEDVISYVLCAHGRIGANLEHFPPERFRASALNMYNFISSI